uniref:Uncharacterized protein n=1 Tax=Anolis carolinensis TaxID=28377 RepID=A0A803TAS1_ANOCA
APAPKGACGSANGEAGLLPGDLRSVLVTSVLNLEQLDVVLFRGPHGARPVPGGAHPDGEELLGAVGQGHPARDAHPHLPGLLPGGAAQPHPAPVPHAGGARPCTFISHY